MPIFTESGSFLAAPILFGLSAKKPDRSMSRGHHYSTSGLCSCILLLSNLLVQLARFRLVQTTTPKNAPILNQNSQLEKMSSDDKKASGHPTLSCLWYNWPHRTTEQAQRLGGNFGRQICVGSSTSYSCKIQHFQIAGNGRRFQRVWRTVAVQMITPVLQSSWQSQFKQQQHLYETLKLEKGSQVFGV